MMSPLFNRLHSMRQRWIEYQVRRTVEARWRDPSAQSGQRTLDGPPIIISLTSYRPRFATLEPTLKSLLRQTVRPAAVVVWIGHDDVDALPTEVRALEGDGLRIMPCDDLRSFTKFIHAVREFPDHRIAICDDDTYYRPHWLEKLAAPLPPHEIACHRIHRIVLNDDGLPIAYNDWQQESTAHDGSPLNFPTGVGGVLFRPEQMHPRIVDSTAALAACPTADDIWLYWMGRLGGSIFVRVGDNDPLISWRTSQHVALWQTNNVLGVANNSQISAMIDRFGDTVFKAPVREAASV